MAKIKIELEISSNVYSAEGMEKFRAEIRRGMTRYLFDCIDRTPIGIGDGPIPHTNFLIEGDIRLVETK